MVPVGDVPGRDVRADHETDVEKDAEAVALDQFPIVDREKNAASQEGHFLIPQLAHADDGGNADDSQDKRCPRISRDRDGECADAKDGGDTVEHQHGGPVRKAPGEKPVVYVALVGGEDRL